MWKTEKSDDDSPWWLCLWQTRQFVGQVPEIVYGTAMCALVCWKGAFATTCCAVFIQLCTSKLYSATKRLRMCRQGTASVLSQEPTIVFAEEIFRLEPWLHLASSKRRPQPPSSSNDIREQHSFKAAAAVIVALRNLSDVGVSHSPLVRGGSRAWPATP